MKRINAIVVVVALILVTGAFLLQRSSPTDVTASRFEIVGIDTQLPVLLDTQTGRTWVRQIAAEPRGTYPVV